MTLLDRHYEDYILTASKEYLSDIVLLTMYNVENMDLLSITPILHKFTELYTLLNRAKESKSSDVTHVTQQDVVVRENKWRCLKYFYANGYNMYVGPNVANSKLKCVCHLK